MWDGYLSQNNNYDHTSKDIIGMKRKKNEGSNLNDLLVFQWGMQLAKFIKDLNRPIIEFQEIYERNIHYALKIVSNDRQKMVRQIQIQV